MPSINFYLDKPDKKGRCPIFLMYRVKGKKFKTFTKQKATPKQWNRNKQRVKSAYTESEEINDELDKLEAKLKQTVRSLRHEEEDFDISDVKERFLGQTPRKKKKNLFSYFEHFITMKADSQQRKTVQEYQTIVNDLKDYEVHYNEKLSFKKIDNQFFSQYLSFLAKEKQNSINTVHKKISTLRTLLNGATKDGYNTNLKYKDFKVKKIQTEKVTLTEEELKAFIQLDLSNNPRLEKVRDMFCFCCTSSIRFSDLRNLKKEAIIKTKDEYGNYTYAIRTHAVKTKAKIFVPLTEYPLSIINKYLEQTEQSKRKGTGTIIFPRISNQKFNAYLKEIGQLAGLDQEIIVPKFVGSSRTEEVFKKYELLSSHAARRTFGTLAKRRKMDNRVLQKIMGHKDIRTTMQYVNTDDDLIMQEMQEVWKGFGEY